MKGVDSSSPPVTIESSTSTETNRLPVFGTEASSSRGLVATSKVCNFVVLTGRFFHGIHDYMQ